MASRMPHFAALSLLTLLVGCDHATKLVAKAELEGERSKTVIRGVLDMQYVENTDTAFNLLRWVPERVRGPALVALGAFALLGLLVALLWRYPDRRVLRAAILLVTAGATGNYLDRVLRGYVVDFMHLRYWPVFNVADVYVTVGIALFFWATLTKSAIASRR